VGAATARTQDAVPYRFRYAERRLRQQGITNVNLDVQYLKQLRGDVPATWLTDLSLSENRPNFMR